METEVIYLINDGDMFEGTLAQADECFGIRIDCEEEDLQSFCDDNGYTLTKKS